jgi:anti-sigma B factor antagonist
MTLLIENIQNITLITVPGTTLDAGSAKAFKTAILPALLPEAKVILDLSELKFVDSSGLGAMLSSLRQLNGIGGDLKLCGMNKSIRSLFELVRMHRVFEIYNTRDEAIRSFETAAGAPGVAAPAREA